MEESTLTRGGVGRTLLRFALPFLGASLLQFLYGAADLMIVGRFADPAGISAVSTGSQVMQAITSLVTGLATGGTVLIGQYAGARREGDVRAVIGTMFSLFTLMAVALTLVSALCTNAIVDLMRVPAEAVVPARQYLFICSCGILFITGYNMVAAMLRGLGDSRRPLYFIAVACVLNIVGDLLLVGVFHMGAAGAALATVCAQGVSLILSLLFLRRRDFPFDFKAASFRLHRRRCAKLLALGAPVAVQNVLVTISFLIITAIVNGIGLNESAAVGVVERIIGFAMLAPFAFMAALSAMTAQNMGARRPDRAKASLKYGILFCLLCEGAMFALLQLFPAGWMSLFSGDGAVIAHGALYLRTYSFDCLAVSLVFCLNGFFGGCGRTGFTMFNDLVSTFAARVPIVFFVSRIAGVTLLQIGVAAPVASTLQVVIQLIYYRTGRWNRSAIGEPTRPADKKGSCLL